MTARRPRMVSRTNKSLIAAQLGVQFAANTSAHSGWRSHNESKVRQYPDQRVESHGPTTAGRLGYAMVRTKTMAQAVIL